MQPLSTQTRQLIEALYARPSLLQQLVRSTADKADLLARIVAAGEPAAIPYLLPATLASNELAGHAASAVSGLLECVPPLHLLQLDELTREVRWHHRDLGDGRRNMRAGDLPRLARLIDGWAVVAMAASHHSGYVREAAVRQLVSLAGPRALPYLIVRMNDWVAPVREAACGEVERLLGVPDFAVLVESLPLVLRMPTWGRVDHAAFLDRVRSILRQPAAEPALLRGIDAADARTRRECIRLALSVGEMEPGHIIARGLESPDDAVRLEAVRGLARLEDGPLRALLERAWSDPFSPARLEALKLTVARFPGEAVSALQGALCDLSAAVRELARHQLAQQEAGFDAAEYYRRPGLSETGSRLRGAILGLAEVGGATDAGSLEPLCSHPHPKTRAAAVRALGRLDAEGRLEALLAALVDSSRRVSNTAASALSQKTGLIEIETLRDYALSEIWPLHARLNALRLLSRLSKWTWLPILLHAAVVPDPQVALADRSYLWGWYSRDFRKPSSQELAEVQDALRETAHVLPVTLRNGISAALRLWLPSP